MKPHDVLEWLEDMLDTDALAHERGYGRARMALNVAVLELVSAIEADPQYRDLPMNVAIRNARTA